MRTGKTKVLVDDFGRLEKVGEVSDLLVIVPASIVQNWIDDIRNHVSPDLLARLRMHAWRASATSSSSKRFERAFLDEVAGPRIMIVNVEALSSVQRAKDACLSFLSKRPGKRMVAVDESTTIKSVDSARGKFVVHELAKYSDYRRILSGLPTPRSPLDLFGQFTFLDPSILGFHNYKSFEARYAVIEQVCMIPSAVLAARLNRFGVDTNNMPRQMMIGELKRRGSYVQTIPQLKSYRNEEELRDKIAPHSYRCLLSDCYDVPAKLYSFRDVEMTTEQEKVYKELKKVATAELENMTYVTATHVVVKILRLHQVLCGHVANEVGDVVPIPENRTKEVLSILREYDGKAIIWTSYDYNVRGVAEAIAKEFGDGSVARFWGGNRSTRDEEEYRFKTDPECRFMVATQSAGGRGKMWAMANLLVYFSSTNNLEHRSQSEERGDANLKEDRVAVIDLRVTGTVDEAIIEALREKIDMASTITGDNWKEWLV
jgi:SNF2 family DNA or RNA helicase